MLEGLDLQQKIDDTRKAYFTWWQISPYMGKNSKITVEDILNGLYPKKNDDIKDEIAEFDKKFNL